MNFVVNALVRFLVMHGIPTKGVRIRIEFPDPELAAHARDAMQQSLGAALLDPKHDFARSIPRNYDMVCGTGIIFSSYGYTYPVPE